MGCLFRGDTGRYLRLLWGLRFPMLDGTIANVALPSIAADLQATPSMSIWIVNAYQLAIVISLLSLSSLGDILGYRRVYIGGLLIFSVTSLACALSNSLLTLIDSPCISGVWSGSVGECKHIIDSGSFILNGIWGGGWALMLWWLRFRQQETYNCGRNFIYCFLAMVICN